MRLDGATIRCPSPVAAWDDAPHSGVLWRAARGRFVLRVPGVARYQVRDGNMIDIDPSGTADASELRRFLRMAPAAALYLQRDIPVLHAAAAIGPDGRAVVLAGYSGAGKSVLLAALMQRGWGALTDDLAPVTLGESQEPAVLPMWPETILWPDSIEHLSEPAPAPRARVPELRPSGLRSALSSHLPLSNQQQPIRALWWLGLHSFDRIDVRDITGISRFEAVGAMAYNRRIAGALLDRGSYLRIAGALAGSRIPIRWLIRPGNRWTADELADVVEREAR